MAERITSGPFRGYFTIPNTIIREKMRDDVIIGERELYNVMREYQMSLTEPDLLFYRYKPGPGRTIIGYNRFLLPQIDGYYYIQKSRNDIRKLTYALENKLIPSSGNTELFNIDYSDVYVPDDYCPYLLDPCPYDWCKRCIRSDMTSNVPMEVSPGGRVVRWIILIAFLFLICSVFGLAILG